MTALTASGLISLILPPIVRDVIILAEGDFLAWLRPAPLATSDGGDGGTSIVGAADV